MKADAPDPNSALLLRLSREVSRIAGSLAQLSISAGQSLSSDYPFSNPNALDVPLDRVHCLIRFRQARSRFLPAELFADPAWDILLDLLRAEIAHEKVSVSSACIAASVPQTTGLRWLRALEQHGLVERERDLHDARRTFVVLSREASIALRRYFLDVVGTAPAETQRAPD